MLWRAALAPIAVLIGSALVELVSAYYPGISEPWPLVLVAVAFAGFAAGTESALLSSLIAITYALFFVAARHPQHGSDFPVCVESIFLATAAPALSITAGIMRERMNKTLETLGRHLSNTPLGVIELYDDFEITLWAGSAERIFGFTQKQAVGKNLFELPGIFYSDEDASEAQLVLSALGRGELSQAVHQSRCETAGGWAGHSRWFWSSTLEPQRKSSRFLVLVEDITAHVRAQEELESSKTELIERLVTAAECRDQSTGTHVARMSAYCEALGKALNLPEEDTSMLRKAAAMHDIGKIGIPDSVLLKAGKLTEEEYAVIRTHTKIGARILSQSKHALVQMAERIALTHHEKWDGSGYPDGLRGEEIPLVGRICAVCDVFDALTSERPYKSAWSVDDVVVELKRLSGSHLDPQIVPVFISILPEIMVLRAEYVRDQGAAAEQAA
jgi:PAS domain S-box-containing protein